MVDAVDGNAIRCALLTGSRRQVRHQSTSPSTW
jgi:hypothetical protein